MLQGTAYLQLTHVFLTSPIMASFLMDQRAYSVAQDVRAAPMRHLAAHNVFLHITLHQELLTVLLVLIPAILLSTRSAYPATLPANIALEA